MKRGEPSVDHFPISAYSRSTPSRQQGFSLVELMVALVLGLLLIAAAGNMFLSNKQTYRTVENLSQLQEGLRFAFELMARDARMAGAIPCGHTDQVANVLNGAAGSLGWDQSVRGYAAGTTISFPAVSICGTGTGAGCRVPGTEALYLSHGAGGEVDAKVTGHNPPSATMTLDNVDNIQTGDILMTCRPSQAAIFQVTNVNSSSNTVVHNDGTSTSPGNSTKCLNYPVDTSLPPSACTDFTGGHISKLSQYLWYIGDNGRGGRSLYRRSGFAPAEEIVANVYDMQLEFLSDTATDYVATSSMASADWPNVRGIRVTLTVESNDQVSTSNSRLSRNYLFHVSLRNRLK